MPPGEVKTSEEGERGWGLSLGVGPEGGAGACWGPKGVEFMGKEEPALGQFMLKREGPIEEGAELGGWKGWGLALPAPPPADITPCPSSTDPGRVWGPRAV